MLLAVDTSTRWISIALFDGDQILAEETWRTRDHHSVELSPAINSMLNRAGSGLDKLAALGVALGPGSFTSLRIGLAVVKGIALARRLPVIGIASSAAIESIAYCGT